MTPEDLCAQMHNPAAAGRTAAAIRDDAWGRSIVIDEAAPLPALRSRAAILRAGDRIACDRFPDAATLQSGDTLLLEVRPEDGARGHFAAWLLAQADRFGDGVRVAPYCSDAAGLHRLWCIAAARIALPPRVRIVARHDLLGIRLAQIALGFGADTLAGPLCTERKLPVAGVTRPNENTRSGLSTLVRQAGLQPVDITRASNITAAEAS